MGEPTTAVGRPIEAAKEFLNNPQLLSQLRVACAKTMTPERMSRIALTAALSSPKLQECFITMPGKQSIAKCLLVAAQRGLEVDGRQGHLVPFRCKQPDGSYAMVAQFIPGYQGLVDLAYNHPNVSAIWSEVVHERDVFVLRHGLNRTLEHEPYDGEDDPGRLIAVYAICELRSGSKVFTVLKQRDIDRIMAFSRGASDPSSPWQTNTEAMWRKSAIRALCKMIPQSAELRDALSDEDAAEREIHEKSAVKVERAAPTFRVAEAKPAAVEVVDSPVKPPPVRRRAAPPQQEEPPPTDEPPPVSEPEPPSDMGGGPVPPEPDQRPADPVPPGGDNPYATLSSYVSGFGADFELLKHALLQAKVLPDTWTGSKYEDIPADMVARLVKAPRQLRSMLQSSF